MLGCGKDWCLMCELEQYVIMLQEGGGPMSPSRILLHIRRINCHIGDGSQEDAHEFLRSVKIYQPILFLRYYLLKILQFFVMVLLFFLLFGLYIIASFFSCGVRWS